MQYNSRTQYYPSYNMIQQLQVKLNIST